MGTKGTTSTETTDDFRVTRARRVLDDTATGHDDYGHAVGQVLELRQVLGGVLGFVDEQADRVDTLDVLTAVKGALDVKLDEVKRLTAIETGLDRLTQAIVGAVETTAEETKADGPLDRLTAMVTHLDEEMTMLVRILGRGADQLDVRREAEDNRQP